MLGTVFLVQAFSTQASAESMRDALVRAYQTNPQIRASRAALRATDEQAAQAFSNWRPTIGISADGGLTSSRTRTDATGRGFEAGDRSPAGASLNVTQQLYRGGRNIHQWRQAKFNIFAERARLADVEQTVFLAVIRVYADVLRNRSVLRLNKNNERVLRRQLRAVRDRLGVGRVTRTDLAQARARLALARANVIQALGTLQASRALYRRLTGVVPTKPRWPRLGSIVPKRRDIIVARARRQNPTVIAAIWREHSARAAVKIAHGELLPTITINGQVQRRFDSLGRRQVSDSSSITANITIPLYQSGAVMSRIRAAKQTVFQRRNELRQTQRQAVENATRAWVAYTTARASFQAYIAQRRANRQALRGVQQEATAGQRTVLDVLDAQQELLSAQINLVGARRDLLVATYEIVAASGRLNAKDLKLPVKYYDPKQYYRNVRFRSFGIGRPTGRPPGYRHHSQRRR